MISHLSRRERIGYTAIIGLLLFGAGYVGGHRLRKPAPIVFESSPLSSSRSKPSAHAVESAKAPLPGAKSRKTIAAVHSVQISVATVEELQTLPGIGPGLAGRIVDYRNSHGPFRSAEGLRQVKGIGEKKLAAIKPYLKP